MSKQRVTHPNVGEPPADTWSNCLIVDRHVYIAGLTARGQDFDGAIHDNDAYTQAVTIFTKIKHLMEAAGGTMDDVVKVLNSPADWFSSSLGTSSHNQLDLFDGGLVRKPRPDPAVPGRSSCRFQDLGRDFRDGGAKEGCGGSSKH